MARLERSSELMRAIIEDNEVLIDRHGLQPEYERRIRDARTELRAIEMELDRVSASRDH